MSKKRNVFKEALRSAAIAASRAALRPHEAPLPPPDDIRKILLVKLWAIGEYLLATPAFAAIREVYPDARVTLLTGLAAAPLAAGAPFFDDVLTVPERIFVRKRLVPVRRLRRRLARESYDLAIIFHHAWEFSAFFAWVGTPHRLGLARDGDGFAHTAKVPPSPGTHQVIEYFSLARACGAAGEPGSLVVTPGPEAREEAAHLLADPAFKGRPRLLVAPGGGVNPKTRMEMKRWPAENYLALINILKRNFDVVLIGGVTDCELNGRLAEETGALNLTGKTSLPTLYVLLGKAAAFVGNDSAPMHLAAAAGAPVAAFFGPTDPKLNGPWRAPSLILSHAAECQPCYRDGYFPACDDRRCLTDLTAAEAAARIYEFLDSIRGRC